MPNTLQSRTCDGQTICTVVCDGRTLGFIVIDSTISGRARGGLRMATELSEAEVSAAARAMTQKYGFLGLPQGGAKAGVVGDPEASVDEKPRVLGAFARAAGDLLREKRYVPDADLGTRAEEIGTMMRSIGAEVSQRDWRANRSGDYTAVSCLTSAEAVLAERGEVLDGRRVAIEGFGDVGSALARRLARRGAKIVAISTSQGAAFRAEGFDVAELSQSAARDGSGFVRRIPGASFDECESLLVADVDVLFPCARMHGIDVGNVEDIRAPIVCAGANNPVSEEARTRLAARGIRFLPEFVTNAGGVLGGTLEFAGVRPDRVEAVVAQRIGREVGDLLRRARGDDLALWALAESEARQRHEAVRARHEQPDLRQRLSGAALDAYRLGWIPERVVAPMAIRMLG